MAPKSQRDASSPAAWWWHLQSSHPSANPAQRLALHSVVISVIGAEHLRARKLLRHSGSKCSASSQHAVA
jgi:hypothetical protein